MLNFDLFVNLYLTTSCKCCSIRFKKIWLTVLTSTKNIGKVFNYCFINSFLLHKLSEPMTNQLYQTMPMQSYSLFPDRNPKSFTLRGFQFFQMITGAVYRISCLKSTFRRFEPIMQICLYEVACLQLVSKHLLKLTDKVLVRSAAFTLLQMVITMTAKNRNMHLWT